MTAQFTIADGALRVRLAPDEYATAGDDASVVGEALRLARAGQVSIEGFSRQALAGLHFRIGINGRTAAGAVRRIQISAGGSTTIDAGAEVSIFPTENALAEVMRCIPRRPDFGQEDRVHLRLSWEAASAIAHDPVGPSAQYAQMLVGWNELPEAVSSVLGQVTCEAAITINSPVGMAVQRWISGDSGWLSLGIVGQDVVLAPSTQDDLARALTRDLTAAVDSMLAGAR